MTSFVITDDVGEIRLDEKYEEAYSLYQDYSERKKKIDNIENNWGYNCNAFWINAFRLLSFIALLVYVSNVTNPFDQEIGWIVFFIILFVVSMCSCCACTVWSWELDSRLEEAFTEGEKRKIVNLLEIINKLRSERDTAVYYQSMNRKVRQNFKLTRY